MIVQPRRRKMTKGKYHYTNITVIKVGTIGKMITKDFSSTYTLPENQTVFCHYTKKIISCQQGFSEIHNQNHLNDLLHYQKNKAETHMYAVMDGWVDTRLFRSLNNLTAFSNSTYHLLKITDSFSLNIVFCF